jgi:N-acetylglucosaminyl-diphospho-decaprenol L-rhamnosyltransferase
MPDLDKTAIIVAAHRWYYPLYRCIESLRNIITNAEDLIFVDNGSSEMLCNWARECFPGMTVLRLEKNSLFAGGYNRGLEYAIDRGYDYALIVNADTHVHNPAFIEELREAAKRWPRAAFLGPLVYHRSSQSIQKTTLFFPDILKHLLVWLPFRFLPRIVSRQQLTESEVEFLNGVCVLCRVSALRDIGLMDEAFGGYVEDADWSFRALKKGWVSVFTPLPSVTHYEEETGYETHSVKTFMLKRNTVLWFLKAGLRTSARLYAFASIVLARVRMVAEHSPTEKENHRYFCRQLQRAYRGLLRGEDLGEWFGPPKARWGGPHTE